MGRSNKAARAKNNRMNRRPKGEPRGLPPRPNIPRIPVSDLILPDGRCTRNPRRPKDMFATREKAQKALDQAQHARARMGSGHVERRFYLCEKSEGGCGGYHLTSRESYDNTWKRATP